ncbi:unnamed protein product [Closterium sp. Naga37s-1]|nr:unnamed protein product [Closterium sp. Naga37s-1]
MNVALYTFLSEVLSCLPLPLSVLSSHLSPSLPSIPNSSFLHSLSFLSAPLLPSLSLSPVLFPSLPLPLLHSLSLPLPFHLFLPPLPLTHMAWQGGACWNRVVVRYCDGASFSGNKSYRIEVPGTNSFIFFRGRHIMPAIVSHLLQHHNLRAASHCMGDGGVFLDTKDVGGQHEMRRLFSAVVRLQVGCTGHCKVQLGWLGLQMRDGGVFLDTKDVGGQHEMRRLFSTVVRLQKVSVHEGLF